MLGPELTSAKIQVKLGAEVSDLDDRITLAFESIISTWDDCVPGIAPVITSGSERSFNRSAKFSYHWHNGQAIDLRLRDLNMVQVICIADLLPKRLPDLDEGRFDLIIHWELQNTAAFHAHLEVDTGEGGTKVLP